MSSTLEIGEIGVVVEIANEDGGLDLITNDQFTVIGEIDGKNSAKDPGDDIIINRNNNLVDDFNFISSGKGNDIIIGSEVDDLIDGETGSDIIRGGDGDDIIIGGKGADILIGGKGEDIFQFQLSDFANGEIDTVKDFESGVDRIVINDIDPGLIAVEDGLIKYDGQTIISIGGDVTGATDEDTFELF